ncbi:hypothetical protein QTP88_013984 [Uroleucon formosanum]
MIKQGVEVESIGAQVSSIIKSQNGELIIRLHPKDLKRLELEDVLKKQLGASAAVRGLVKYEVEVLDLDCVTTETELETCIRKALGSVENDQSTKVKNVRQSFRGALLSQVTVEKSANFVIVCEPNRKGPSWYIDKSGDAAIINIKRTRLENEGLAEPGFRWVTAHGIRIYSCYWSPTPPSQNTWPFLRVSSGA